MNSIITLPGQGAAPVGELELCAWVAQALPGDALEYHRGFLCLDRTPFGRVISPEQREALIRTSARARQLAEDGLVHLAQRRVAAGEFSYLAIARPRGSRPLPSILLAEEAA